MEALHQAAGNAKLGAGRPPKCVQRGAERALECSRVEIENL